MLHIFHLRWVQVKVKLFYSLFHLKWAGFCPVAQNKQGSCNRGEYEPGIPLTPRYQVFSRVQYKHINTSRHHPRPCLWLRLPLLNYALINSSLSLPIRSWILLSSLADRFFPGTRYVPPAATSPGPLFYRRFLHPGRGQAQIFLLWVFHYLNNHCIRRHRQCKSLRLPPPVQPVSGNPGYILWCWPGAHQWEQWPGGHEFHLSGKRWRIRWFRLAHTHEGSGLSPGIAAPLPYAPGKLARRRIRSFLHRKDNLNQYLPGY